MTALVDHASLMPPRTDAARSPGRLRSLVRDALHQPSLLAAIVGGLALLGAWLLSPAGVRGSAANSLLVICYVLCGTFAIQRAWEPLRQFKIDIHVMMLVGAGLALWIGHPEEGALLLFLFALSGSLEILATGRAERAVHSLGEQFPTEALVERAGQRLTVRLAEVVVEDRLIVRPGDRVACDGEIIDGASHVDESAITGEFMPKSKSLGEPVYAGSLNGEQTLIVRVTSAAAQSTLARVAELVQAARAQRTRMESMIDQVGRWYGPAVLSAALVMLLVARGAYGETWSAAIYRAIALLIGASPCALILATPVPILCAIANAARNGIVAKGGAYFERLAGARTLFVDKTGTLTTGRVRLADVQVFDGADAAQAEGNCMSSFRAATVRERCVGIDANTPLPHGRGSEKQDADERFHESMRLPWAQALREAAGLERDSTHPLAAAVLNAARERGHEPDAVDDMRALAGQGIAGRIGGREVRLGRPEWALDGQAASTHDAVMRAVQAAESEGRTPVVLAGNGSTAVLTFEDTMRPGAEHLAADLRREGVERVELLTGDRRGVGEAMVRRAGLDACHAQLLPADKLDFVSRAVRGGHGVVMLGDGVNDAPALARADVGIAMGGIGSHTALESADFVLLHDRVELLPDLVRLARRTRRIMVQNVVIALGVICLLAIWIALTSAPVLSLAVIGHEGSTLVVVANGLRVLSRGSRRTAAIGAGS